MARVANQFVTIDNDPLAKQAQATPDMSSLDNADMRLVLLKVARILELDPNKAWGTPSFEGVTHFVNKFARETAIDRRYAELKGVERPARDLPWWM